MDKETLLKAGYTEEQATAILKMHKEAIDANYIPKHRFDEVNTELKNTKTQLGERDVQIGELKKFEGTAAELQTKITELTNANATKDTEHQKALALEKKKNAVKMALLDDENGKPHDSDMVMGLFNLENIVTDENGKITAGYKEQADTIRKEKAFLFGTKESGDGKPAGWKPAGTEPPEGDKGKGGTPDEATAFGKSLAQVKLGMMGIKPAGNETGA